MRKIKIIICDILAWLSSISYLMYWLLVHCVKSDFMNHVKKIRKGRTIDVIVNGPSFAKQKDDVINDGHDKCMVNFAANTPVFWELKPIYYCISDPNFFKGINFNSPKEVEVFINNIKRVTWNLTIFIPYQTYKRHVIKSDLHKLPYIRFIPFHSTQLPFSFRFRKLSFWLFKRGQAMPNPTSVSVPVILNMINTGYSIINLYGFDHDWIHNVVVDNNNRVCLYDTHYYNEKGEIIPWLKNKTETFKMHEVLQTQVELFESYWFIKEYVDYLGNVKVVNKSPNSLLDAFDRK